MSESRNNGRSPMAVAMQWVSQITTVGLEMALPALGGYWLDTRWGTEPWLMIVGCVLGFGAGFTHLLQMTRRANSRHGPRSDSGRRRDGKNETTGGRRDGRANGGRH